MCVCVCLTLLHRINIKIEEKRKLYVSKHLYQCSLGKFKMLPLNQTHGYTLLQIKGKIFYINLNQS